MMSLPQYPLLQVLDVKRRRLEAAEKAVAERKAALELEQDKLRQLEVQRDKVKKHYIEKLDQFRRILDEGTTTDKIQQSKVYIKLTEEKLRVEQEKVSKQMSEVDTAKQNLLQAREVFKEHQREVDKIVKHREEWTKETVAELELQESNEQDELGNVIHLSNQRKSQS